jgi:hypothetical protein
MSVTSIAKTVKLSPFTHTRQTKPPRRTLTQQAGVLIGFHLNLEM